MARKIADCREFPSEVNCTLTISGEEEEVVRAAAEHAASVHGHENTAESRARIRQSLGDAPADQATGMRFVQLIEFRTRQSERLQALLEEWEAATGGKRTATRATLTADQAAPESYYEFVEFPSYGAAMRNSRLPETDALAKRMRALCEEEPVFHNLDVVRTEAL